MAVLAHGEQILVLFWLVGAGVATAVLFAAIFPGGVFSRCFGAVAFLAAFAGLVFVAAVVLNADWGLEWLPVWLASIAAGWFVARATRRLD